MSPRPSKANTTQSRARIIAMKSSYAQESIVLPPIDKIALVEGAITHIVSHDHILRIEAASNYTSIYLIDGQFITLCKTLGALEKQLPSSFMRIHQSHIVSLNAISQIINLDRVVLSDGTQVRIARSKRKLIKKFIQTIQL